MKSLIDSKNVHYFLEKGQKKNLIKKYKCFYLDGFPLYERVKAHKVQQVDDQNSEDPQDYNDNHLKYNKWYLRENLNSQDPQDHNGNHLHTISSKLSRFTRQ